MAEGPAARVDVYHLKLARGFEIDKQVRRRKRVRSSGVSASVSWGVSLDARFTHDHVRSVFLVVGCSMKV